MEGALAAAASRFMVQKVADLLQLDQKLKAMTGIKRKMEKLKELSTIIDKVIQDIDSRPSIDDAVKDLLEKLKYLAYDLEDVVDYYDIKVFQKQRSKTFLRPVSDFFSSDNQVVFKSRVGGMIKTITESLDSILLQKSILQNLSQSSIRMSEQRETHSRNSFVVIGREPEKNMIVNMLTKDDDDDDESNHGTVKVIAIVGMGGLGKTTLAQIVYNDARVQDHFASLRMWKVVGAEFDPAKIMKSVLQLAAHKSVEISEIDLVRQKLEKALSGKRFLLVLDDVWNEDPFEWGKLKAALTCGASGSKILVTTRSQQVSKIMGSSNTTHQLQQLSEDDCLSLFQQFAFGDQAVDQKLMEISKQIIEKCGGVPLAAISLGSMLRGTRDKTYWSSVLKSEIWQLRDEQKVLAVLKWSYDTLPLQSKKCFAFGSLFPKDYTMQKDELIKLWISNGFVRSERNFDAETVGNRIFDDLVLRSFFLLAPFEDDPHVTHCTMHDLMHDLSRSVSANVYWNVEDSVEDIGNRTYHLHLCSTHVSKITQALGKKPLYLRTLILSSCGLFLNANPLEIVFSELKFLRVLDLSDNDIREVPTSIGNLIHLRYLNLSTNKIEVLPDSMTLLPNLQYLNLSFNYKLRELPKDLGNMQSLRDLTCRRRGFVGSFFRSGLGLTHMPCGLSRLINLHSLPVFVAGDRTGACSILELEDLKLHGEIEVIFSKDFKNYSCGGRKIFKNKDLNEVYIEFNRSESNDKDMLDDLGPNTSLNKLTIFHYGSRQFPTWLMELQLPNLVEVRLVNCRVCEHIPPFGNLQFLKKLDLHSMYGITQMGAEFHGYGGFPSLQELRLTWMDNLDQWSEAHGVGALFPVLQRVKIIHCPKLKSMPMLPTIQHLEISYCCGSILSCIGRLTSLSFLKAAEINDMTSFPSGCIRNLISLTELKIIECRQLQSLPGDEMQHLEMLRSLTIEKCDNLASFPSEVGRLSSLCFLRLSESTSIIFQPEELVQILNSVPKFQIQICSNKVNLRGQLQYLHTLKELSLRGQHYLFTKYRIGYEIAKLSICCCDELESLMTTEPTSSVLEKLYIDGISNLMTLPGWLQYLSSLCFLRLSGCPSIVLQPEELVQILNSVPKFQIQICGNKVNLHGRLQHLHTLRGLFLMGAHYGSSFYEYRERYENPKLSICCCDELESLMTAEATSSVLEELSIHGISNLTTLPDWLRHLKSLRVLSLQNCSELGLLPRGLKNLPMLETFRVSNCPQLKRRCEREIGEDWPIISHLPSVHIS
ncbi:putative disease resistance protein RGA3 [Zingiber officinale]|uniref:Uncharacterized protein n=1 Tax=Zingiber officinale TaxID=94328 RepID=A0A8J5G957_ZINOF|nr:putative disease resistance protein RGA3 [Zingiber officinale]XP_042399575.1 putative disease resistance protein RGA3 [Zingiber officinale]KAG6498154.1 hypothetical protein ZIOFF_046063 [Zingiber officinale]